MKNYNEMTKELLIAELEDADLCIENMQTEIDMLLQTINELNPERAKRIRENAMLWING